MAQRTQDKYLNNIIFKKSRAFFANNWLVNPLLIIFTKMANLWKIHINVLQRVNECATLINKKNSGKTANESNLHKIIMGIGMLMSRIREAASQIFIILLMWVVNATTKLKILVYNFQEQNWHLLRNARLTWQTRGLFKSTVNPWATILVPINGCWKKKLVYENQACKIWHQKRLDWKSNSNRPSCMGKV